MGNKVQGRLIIALALTLAVIPSFARKKERQEEDIVRLMNAKSLELIEQFGNKYRKTIDATFLHNGTYFICDTAIWDEQQKVINAWGNVQLIQDKTVLSSERMDYYTEENVAKFRGSIVQLQDKDNNTLRTRHLDYFTKDSLAVFRNGSSMRSKDGQIIESLDGEYDSKSGIFSFDNQVNMFTDSIFVHTQEMKYDSKANQALFTTYIDFWKEDNMLSAQGGWYDRPQDLFFFTRDVHATSREQEMWCDSLFFFRPTGNIEMFGSVQVQDQSRDVTALANYMFYEDSLSTITMRDQAAVALTSDNEQKGAKDTVFIGADNVKYYTVKVCDIPEEMFAEAKTRVETMMQDAVAEYRIKAAADAAEEAKKAKKEYDLQNGIVPQEGNEEQTPAPSEAEAAPAADSETSELPAPDSLAAVEVDTSKIGFLTALGDVKVYRDDLQVNCDSLLYSDIDSVARLYIEPVVWNEMNRQYSSDSIFVLIKDNYMERADLQSNAFIITYEDEKCYDQIKANEVMAYFDTTSALRRFDALGGAQAMFYLEENDAMATVNKVESRILTATFVGGDLDRVFYFENPKNDAFPTAQLTDAERYLKGFKWQPDRRPESRYQVTDLEYRPSEREVYESRPRSTFPFTDEFFPGYIPGIYHEIQVRDSIARSPKPAAPPQVEIELADTLADEKILTLPARKAPIDDSLTVQIPAPDTVAVAAPDSTGVTAGIAVVDSVSVDTVSVAPAVVADRIATERRIRTAEREKAAAERQARREAHWKELDERDAAKAAEREKQLKEIESRRLAKEMARRQRQQAREQKRLDKFIRYYEKRKAHQGARKSSDEDYLSPFTQIEQTD